MCILFWTLNRHVDYQFIFAGNRDEFLNRPTASADFWGSPNQHVLAGRDLDPSATATHDGTWLGITRDGRFAALTNYRERRQMGMLSRGCLVRDYLVARQLPETYLQSLESHKQDFGGFNLICGQLGTSSSLLYTSNRDNQDITELQSGEIYGISNSVLPQPWAKVEKGKNLFEKIVDKLKDKDEIIEALFNMMRESCPYSGSTEALWEEVKSTIFVEKIELGQLSYATRTTTVILVDYKGHVTFVEREWYPRTSQIETNLKGSDDSDDSVQRRYDFDLN